MTDALNNPHPVEEDPEDHIGDVIPDPWDDPEQTDWPQATEEAAEDVSKE